jgi:hypothetical protein
VRTIAAILLSAAVLAVADPPATSVGVGTRAYGMGNNFTALSNDFSSLYWNPAGMAFVPVREAHIAVDWNRQDMTGILSGDTASNGVERLRVSSGGLLRALPTTRGGYAFALGFLSPWLLDDVSARTGHDVYRGSTGREGFADTLWPGDTLFRDHYNGVSKGSCNLWSMGMGWQIAPNLGFGFSIGLLMGSEQRDNDFVSHLGQRSFENAAISIDRAYFGYDARVGLMYKPRPAVSLGCRVELPRFAKVAENYQEINWLAPAESYEQSDFGVLKSSFSGAFGVAFLLPFATIAADASARAPLSDALPHSDGSYWKGGGGIGIEAPLPWIASLVRGGYAYSQSDLSPMLIVWDEGGVDDEGTVSLFHGRHLLTAGYSLLIGSGVSLEAAYGYQVWDFSLHDADWVGDVKEAHGRYRVMVSAAIRY